MTRDYGSRSAVPRRGRRLALIARIGVGIGVVGPILMLAVIPTIIGLAAGAPDPANPKRGSAGRPCRPISKTEFERGWKVPPRTFVYQGATFARRRGDADCTVLHDGAFGGPYPACRLSAPAGVSVTYRGRSAYFATDPGMTVEVEARPSGARCVVTAKHQL